MARAEAPGRVNLIGEHTDYNDGLVLPATIPLRVAVELSPHPDASDALVTATSQGFLPLTYALAAESRSGDWGDHVRGVTWALRSAGHRVSGFACHITSDIPPGAGLASSAALAVALLRALCAAFDLVLDDRAIALLAHRAEHDFVGARVGRMDQLAASLGRADEALFIDTRSLEVGRIALPPELALVVLDSGVPHRHASGGYNTRRAECEEAARLLDVPALRDATLAGLARLERHPLLAKRAQHVITENERVRSFVAALRARDLAACGALINESHRSLRDDFEVSTPEIDALVDLLRAQRGVLGARIVGGGFGGSVLAIADPASARSAADAACTAFRDRVGSDARVLLPVGLGPRGKSVGWAPRRLSDSAKVAATDAERIFTGIGRSYDRVAAVLSFGQDPRWRRALVDAVDAAPTDRVLDVATGTGLVAEALVRRYGCRVVGLDQSADMLAVARARVGVYEDLVEARAERLPFADATFEHLTFTYLLRYVEDPAATLRELARVVKPGGRVASLEFALPTGLWRPLWWLYTRIGLPIGGRVVSAKWSAVGAFLGPSIERFYARHSQSALEHYWTDAGLVDVRTRRMSLGGGVVMSATKMVAATRTAAPAPLAPAFYAARSGGWRDYWTLLHPPYTVWHLSYVLLGASLAPAPDPRIVAGALLAFGLAVGVGAHAFDELRGRPLRTRIPSPVLVGLGALALAIAVGLGLYAATLLGPLFLVFVAVGGALVLLYAFEAPIVHSDLGFALGWGAFPVVAAAYATGAHPVPTVIAALAAALLSLAQRRLSTRARSVRRRATSVSGEVIFADGSRETIDRGSLIAAPEGALRVLWLAVLAVAVSALLSRWL